MERQEMIELWSLIGQYEALNSCDVILQQFPALKDIREPIKKQMNAISDKIEDLQD